jgi:hypothetical protein
VSSRRSILAVALASVTVLSACGASAPPAKELATEMVDTMLSRGEVTEAAATCMRDEIDGFTLTDEQATGFSDFDDVASKAAGNNELALKILADFQAVLAACN